MFGYLCINQLTGNYISCITLSSTRTGSESGHRISHSLAAITASGYHDPLSILSHPQHSSLYTMSFLLRPLAIISASALSLLGLVSTRSKKARYYFHLTLYFSTMGLCSILGVVYSIALSLVGQVSIDTPSRVSRQKSYTHTAPFITSDSISTT